MNDPIELKDFNGEVAIIPDAYVVREKAIEESEVITEVVDHFTKGLAVEALKSIAQIMNQTEKARKQLKAPVIALGKKIDQCAKDYLGGKMFSEQARVNKLLNGYTQEQLRIQREEQRRLQEEQLKLQQEREAERRKLEAAKDAEEKAAISLKIQKATQAVADTEAMVKHMPKVEGVSVREFTNFEVLDIMELAKARPDLVRIEPKRQEILALIKTDKEIPGLRIFSDSSTGVRA